MTDQPVDHFTVLDKSSESQKSEGKASQTHRFVIITGMSGAGKSLAIKCFEDASYFCIDNLPPALMTKFVELCIHSRGRITRATMVMDIRGGVFFNDLSRALDQMEKKGFDFTVVFLDASDDILVRRFKETRRKHPLAATGTVLDDIRAERRMMNELKGRADIIIDTSSLSKEGLSKTLREVLIEYSHQDRMVVDVVSFGYKYGIPTDSDLIFDVRFLPNPHYIENLRPMTGEDGPVEKYVMMFPVTENFFEKLLDMISFLIPHYLNEGKSHLQIAIGCTGGRHRSVAIARKLVGLLGSDEIRPRLQHRDIDKS